ncbi:MAG: TIGR02281 family clan AA aspartic protease [Oricola sp.]
MNALAFLVFGVLGAALLILVFNGNDGTIGPMTDGQFASTVYLGLFGTVLAATLIASGKRFGELARQAGIWLAIIVMLVIGYEYRFDLKESAVRVTSGLMPREPVSAQGADGTMSVTIRKIGRHFETAGMVNGARQDFLVDTGASTVVLTEANARKAGIDPDTLDFRIPVSTANGKTMAARVTGVQVAIGNIVRPNLTVLVAQDGQLDSNLLGMNFLDTLHSYEVQRDRMVLRN